MNDLIERKKAGQLDNNAIVFAPAGSGKTSELTKYILKSLSIEAEPEKVLAISFTIKAVAEMRNRVIEQLKNAEQGTPFQSEHEVEMRELALAVLKRDKERGWNLIKNSNRLEIKTLDGLCSSIVRQFPMASNVGGKVSVSHHPEKMYQAAAADFLRDFDSDLPWSENVRAILAHLNNSFDRANEILVEMLQRRDQWLPLVLNVAHIDDVRDALTENNKQLVKQLATPFLKAFKKHEPALLEMIGFIKPYLPDTTKYKEVLTSIQYIPTTIDSSEEVEILQALSNWLLTTSNPIGIRKTFRAAEGFPAKKAIKDKAELARMDEKKSDMKVLAEALREELQSERLSVLRRLNTFEYTDKEWGLLSKLLTALPILASKLLLEFKKANECDFIEIASAASMALGDTSAPSDALLRLDNRYRHILVDEFQDTSMLQVQLLEKLTSGWQPGDGRSLYIVGDPIQAIYGFRGGNSSLFMRLAINGINDLAFERCLFTSNFRSESQIVDWVNSVFSKAISNDEDLNLGTTTYTPSVCAKPAGEGEAVNARFFSGNYLAQEAEYIGASIKQIEQDDPNATIALLARARSDLREIIMYMKSQDVGHRALKIHKLADNPVIMDLTALTRAVCHLADKTAWLALLRSPLVGLGSSDLLNIVQSGERSRRMVVLDRLSSKEWQIKHLPTDIIPNIRAFVKVMRQSINQLERKSLSDIVRGAFYALGGMSALVDKADVVNINTYFDMLDTFTFTTFSVKELDKKLEGLYSQDLPAEDNSVQLMTVHQSKGLEFDYVFIPSCHKGMRPDQSRLLEHDVLYSDDFQIQPILAPSPEAGVTGTSMYGVIRAFQSMKRQMETTRLAYVAVTRAIKKIFLTGEANPDAGYSQFPKASFFAILQSGLPGEMDVARQTDTTQLRELRPQRRVIEKRSSPALPEGNLLASYRGKMHVNNDILPALSWFRDMVRISGVVVHKATQALAINGPTAYFGDGLAKYRELWRIQLKQAGLEQRLVPQAIVRIEKHLSTIEQSQALRWYFQSRTSLETEKPFYLKVNGKWRKQIIDLTFVEGSTRYIMDTKTAEPEESESESAFEDRMLAQFESKMSQYEQCFSSEGLRTRKGLILTSIGKTVLYGLSEMVVGG